jgi:AraC family transcriptional regulator
MRFSSRRAWKSDESGSWTDPGFLNAAVLVALFVSMRGYDVAVTTGATSVHAVDLPFGRVSAMRFPAGLHLQMHQHPRATIAVILQGGFAGSYDHREHECRATNVVVEPAGESHANRFGDAQSTILTLSLSEEDLQGSFASLVEGIRFARDPFVTQVARRAQAELNEPDDLMPVAVESAALELMTRLARSARNEGRPAWLNRAREHLHDRYADPLQLSDIANEVGVEPERLARTFRRAFGEPMASYLRRLRVEVAATMLAGGDLPISQVAADVGFADQSHMTRCFARYLGITPARYREQRRRNRSDAS